MSIPKIILSLYTEDKSYVMHLFSSFFAMQLVMHNILSFFVFFSQSGAHY